MPANLPTVSVPVNQWVDLYALTGVPAGTAIEVENVGDADIRLAVSASQPAQDSEAYNVVLRAGSNMRNTTGDPGAWAYCRTAGRLSVRRLDGPTQGFYPSITVEAQIDNANFSAANVGPTGAPVPAEAGLAGAEAPGGVHRALRVDAGGDLLTSDIEAQLAIADVEQAVDATTAAVTAGATQTTGAVNTVADRLGAATPAPGADTVNDRLRRIEALVRNGAVSDEGVNTYLQTTGPEWDVNTLTTVGEQNDFQYCAFSLHTDEGGTLYAEQSPDGVNWGRYPTAGYTITAGVPEFRSFFKGPRHVRFTFEGVGGRTYFRLYTYYTNSQVQLDSVLRQDLSLDSGALTTKSVGAGEVRNFDGSGSGVVSIAQLTPEKAQVMDMPPVTIYNDSSEISGAIPSGPLPTYTPDQPIVAPNVRDTFWIDRRQLNVAVSRFYATVPGAKVFIADASDPEGRNSNTVNFAFPALKSVAGVGRNVRARTFQYYVRVIIVNDTGSPLDQWAFLMRGNNTESGDINISADELILTSFPMTLGQNLIRGEAGDGSTITYPVQVHRSQKTGRVALAVYQAARLSEDDEKSHVDASAEASGTTLPIELLVHTVTPGTETWVTDLEINATSTLSAGGILRVRDGGPTGPVRRRYVLVPATNQTNGLTAHAIGYQEPFPVQTSLHVSSPSIGVAANITVNMNGYREPL